MAHCRKDHLEPPAPAKAMRLVTSAVNTFEERLCQATGRLSATTRTLLGEPVVEDTGDDASVGGGQPFLAELKADPGGAESLLGKIAKLERVRKLQLPPELFGDMSEKPVAAWRAHATASAGSPWPWSTPPSPSTGRGPRTCGDWDVEVAQPAPGR